MKYQAVIFDLFGTLVDVFSQVEYYSVLREMISVLKAPDEGFIKLWRDTAAKRGDGTYRTLEENLADICRELNVPATPAQINLAKRIRYDYIALALTPRPGAIEVLSQLKTGGYKVGLISNCSTEPPVIWPYTPFAPFFDVTVFSSTSGLRKPDPRIYALATEQLKVKPESCLYICDGDSGELEGAAQAGMYPILIRDPNLMPAEAVRENSEPLEWRGPVITSLREVPGLLEP